MVKLNETVPHAKGSFGIPPELKAQGDKLFAERRQQEEDKRAKADYQVEHDSPMDMAMEFPDSAFEGKVESKEEKEEKQGQSLPTAEEILEREGIKLEDEDYHNIVFKGFLEKTVTVFPAIGKSARELKATIKTLKTKEYDAIDELLAADIKDTLMTNDGYTSRRSEWIISMAVSKLDGKNLARPVFIKDEDNRDIIDLKATAKMRKKVIGELAPLVLNEIIRIHALLTTCLERILIDHKSEFLKKSLPPRGA